MNVKVLQSDRVTLVIDLHDGTTVKTISFDVGDPTRAESWFFSWDASGGTLAKAQYRPQQGRLTLLLLGQAGMTNLRAKAEAIRDAFGLAGNYLQVQYDGDTSRYFLLYGSQIAPALIDAETVLKKRVNRWEVTFMMNPIPYGQSVPAVM